MINKVSFVIPCYRSEKTICSVIDEIDKTMMEHDAYQYEIILVNDSSPDGVWYVITELARARKDVKAISFSRNFGQHAALMAGYQVAKGNIIVTADDDGQTPLDQVFELIKNAINKIMIPIYRTILLAK